MSQPILPAIIAPNQKGLDQALQRLKSLVRTIHLDVMDKKFVPNSSLNFNLRLKKSFYYQAHLMVKNPEAWLKEHGKKVNAVLFHFESLKKERISGLINKIKSKRKKVGLALNPETRPDEIKPYLNQLDYVLILTVRPGRYGAEFLPQNLKKIQEIKKLNPKIKIIVDGGMNPQTIKEAKKAGADLFVSGSYLTKAENPEERIKNLIKAVKKK